MRVLITGGAGFIGSNLALRLTRDGHIVTVLDTLSPQIHGETPETSSPLFASIRDKVRFVRGSVCDESAMADCLEGQEAVVHLAAETGTGQSMYEIRRYADVNVGGTAVLLDRLANHPHSVRRVVVASSRAIYGEGKYRDADGTIVYPGARRAQDMSAGRFEPLCPRTGHPLQVLPTDEESRIHPSSVYGITKQNQDDRLPLDRGRRRGVTLPERLWARAVAEEPLYGHPVDLLYTYSEREPNQHLRGWPGEP